LIVAQAYQHHQLSALYENGISNGVKGLRFLGPAEIRKAEPALKANISAAIEVPSAGIIDSHNLMKMLEYGAICQGADIVYDTQVESIVYDRARYALGFVGEDYTVRSPVVINAAGLWATQLSTMLGIDTYKVAYCKGDYYKTTRYKNMKHLIYPLPDEHSLGIHSCLSLAGDISFGPNAYFVDTIGYQLESDKEQFVEEINKYLDIKPEDLHQDYCGIRPKVGTAKDFIIKNERESGYKNFINLLGIESPGLTSCLSIAKMVTQIIEE
jgi:L-2-hydroxyglutarate oxidase LhgO